MDALEHIRDQLSIYGGRQKMAGQWLQVQCPLHKDNTPSGGIVVTRDHHKYPLGFYHCFSCGKNLPWNEFATAANLEQIKGFDSGQLNVSENHVSNKIEDDLLGQDTYTLKAILRISKCPEAQPWIETLEWRGYKGSFIKKLGGLIVSDDYKDSIAVLFPIKINGKYRGSVKAVYERKGKELGYISMSGDWVKDFGLFGFEYAQAIIARKKLDFVVLVEGPRDAMRLLRAGIPAMAILGANNFGIKKAAILKRMGIQTVYCMPDNDDGGTAMWKKIKSIFLIFGKANSTVDLKKLALPVEYTEDGELIKMDPGNMPLSILKEVKSFLLKT